MTKEELVASYHRFKRALKYGGASTKTMTSEVIAGMLLYIDGPSVESALAALERDFAKLKDPRFDEARTLLKFLL